MDDFNPFLFMVDLVGSVMVCVRLQALATTIRLFLSRHMLDQSILVSPVKYISLFSSLDLSNISQIKSRYFISSLFYNLNPQGLDIIHHQ